MRVSKRVWAVLVIAIIVGSVSLVGSYLWAAANRAEEAAFEAEQARQAASEEEIAALRAAGEAIVRLVGQLQANQACMIRLLRIPEVERAALTDDEIAALCPSTPISPASIDAAIPETAAPTTTTTTLRPPTTTTTTRPPSTSSPSPPATSPTHPSPQPSPTTTQPGADDEAIAPLCDLVPEVCEVLPAMIDPLTPPWPLQPLEDP